MIFVHCTTIAFLLEQHLKESVPVVNEKMKHIFIIVIIWTVGAVLLNYILIQQNRLPDRRK